MTPRFSIVTPVYDPPEDALTEMIRSVRRQTRGDWELSSSTTARRSGAHAARRSAAGGDRRHPGRCSHASQRRHHRRLQRRARRWPTGEFVALLDHDDLLARTPWRASPRPLDADPDLDYFYSDEDNLDPDGRASSTPFYKPDWSPERLRSPELLLPPVGAPPDARRRRRRVPRRLRRLARTTTSSCASPSRPGYVHHIPEVLYHWRMLPTSVAGEHRGQALRLRGRAARRRRSTATASGSHATVETQEPLGTYRVRRHLRDEPLVSIIIPTRGIARRVWGVERDLRGRGRAERRRAGDLPERRVRGRRRHTHPGRRSSAR